MKWNAFLNLLDLQYSGTSIPPKPHFGLRSSPFSKQQTQTTSTKISFRKPRQQNNQDQTIKQTTKQKHQKQELQSKIPPSHLTPTFSSSFRVGSFHYPFPIFSKVTLASLVACNCWSLPMWILPMCGNRNPGGMSSWNRVGWLGVGVGVGFLLFFWGREWSFKPPCSKCWGVFCYA